MRRINSNDIGISQGSRMLFADYKDGGPMWSGDGPRESRYAVVFDEAYACAPNVHVAMSMWDTDSETNQRVEIAAEHIRDDGFDLVFRTWGDTRVARVRATWLAIGPLRHEDDWELY